MKHTPNGRKLKMEGVNPLHSKAKTGFLLGFILILCGVVFAETQSSKDIVANTLLVDVNSQDTYKKGNSINFQVRVFNYTGLMVNGTSMDCNLRVYNLSNFPIIESVMYET